MIMADRLASPLVIVHARDGVAARGELPADVAGAAEVRVCDGPPVEEFLRAERLLDPTLLVVGAAASAGPTEPPVARLARDVARAASGPVLVVRSRGSTVARGVRMVA